MDAELKERLLDAAVTANKLWQRDIANAINAAVAEIERLHQVLYEQGQRAAEVSKAMLTVLPLLRRIEQPTEEMLDAMSQDETPFVCRRKMDKSGYEVVRADNVDWREVISDEQTVVFEGSSDESQAYCRSATLHWRYGEMMRIANEQSIPNPEHKPA
jgi:hypothetical protein